MYQTLHQMSLLMALLKRESLIPMALEDQNLISDYRVNKMSFISTSYDASRYIRTGRNPGNPISTIGSITLINSYRCQTRSNYYKYSKAYISLRRKLLVFGCRVGGLNYFGDKLVSKKPTPSLVDPTPSLADPTPSQADPTRASEI